MQQNIAEVANEIRIVVFFNYSVLAVFLCGISIRIYVL